MFGRRIRVLSIASLLVVALLSLAGIRSAGAAIVSYWNFDTKSGTTIPDVMGSHDGTLTAGADISTGGQGYGGSGEALSLTTDGDYMDVTSPTTLDFNSAFTWYAMIKTADNSGAIFSRNPDGTAWNQGSKALFVRGSTVQVDAGWVGNPRSNTAVDDDEWHQVIITFNPTGDAFNIYIDGDHPVSSTFDMNRYDEHTHEHNGGFADTSFTVGKADFSGGLSNLDTLVGLIDDAAVFDAEMTGDDLTTLMSQGPAAFVPEPASMALLAVGGLLALRRRRRV